MNWSSLSGLAIVAEACCMCPDAANDIRKDLQVIHKMSQKSSKRSYAEAMSILAEQAELMKAVNKLVEAFNHNHRKPLDKIITYLFNAGDFYSKYAGNALEWASNRRGSN